MDYKPTPNNVLIHLIAEWMESKPTANNVLIHLIAKWMESKPSPSPNNVLIHLIAGGTAGTTGAVLTCPLEVVKTRLQSSVSSFVNLHFHVHANMCDFWDLNQGPLDLDPDAGSSSSSSSSSRKTSGMGALHRPNISQVHYPGGKNVHFGVKNEEVYLTMRCSSCDCPILIIIRYAITIRNVLLY